MEIINNSSVEVQREGMGTPASISFKDAGYRIHFSKKLRLLADIKLNDYVHFVHDVDRLYFFIDNTNSDGVRIASAGKRGGTYANSKGVIGALVGKVPGLRRNLVYPVRRSVTKFNGNTLYEILIHKQK